MKWLDKLFEWFMPDTPPVDVSLIDVSLIDEGNICPHCRGLGYDASGYTCTCLREKK